MTRDYAFEALAEVTSTDWNAGRGELNAALKSIREQTPDLEDSYLLAAEIHDRAKAYRELMPDVLLTPSALAKHWLRAKEMPRKVRGQNLSAEPPSRLPPRHAAGLTEARKLMQQLWPEG